MEAYRLPLIFLLRHNFMIRRVAEFHMRLTFIENIPHRHKG